MVTRNNEHRVIRHSVEEPPGLFKLMSFSPLCQVAANNDGIGSERRNGLQQSLRDRGQEWRPEMQIGYMENFGRHIR